MTHELAHIPHPPQPPRDQALRGVVRPGLAELLDLRAHQMRPRLAMGLLDDLEQLRLGGHHLRPSRHLHQDMEVVGHDAKGHHAQPAEALVQAHEVNEHLLLLRTEDEGPVHDAADAVVIGHGKVARSFQTRLAHGGEDGRQRGGSQAIS